MSDMAISLQPTQTMDVFIDAVKARMDEKGITQIELAKRLGVSKATVNQRLLKNAGNCSFKTADEMAAALGTTTIELLKSHGQ